MITPDILKPGDTIGIAATARKITLDELQGAIQIFESWGLKIKFSPTLFSEQHQFGGSDLERLQGMQALMDDKEVKAIIIVRGGYGTVRIIDSIDFSQFIKYPKWIIGFSDITVLHSHILRHYKIETLHALMAFNLHPDRQDLESINSLKNMLMSSNAVLYETESHPMNRIGEANGELVGGNLSVLYSLLGSNSDIDTTGKILFLEDLDEYLYHIDRMMMALKRTGKLNGIKGLVIGAMSDMRDNAIPFGMNALEIIQSHTAEYNYPICYGFPSGHEKRNVALRFGAEVKLHVGTKVTLQF